jgi:histidine ammonia-lyase
VGRSLLRLLNGDRLPEVPVYGSIGMADLAPLASIAEAVFQEMAPAPGEALALIDNSAFSVGAGALALHDASRLVAVLEVTGALALEAFAANLAPLDPVTVAARPYPGLARSTERLRTLLAGSFLERPGAARHLQDPLTFRGIAHVLGALRDALAFARTQAQIELNAHQGNPFVDVEAGTVRPAANFEVLPLAQAVDVLRVALAPALTTSQERTLKLLDTPWSGLPTGLVPSAGSDSGMTILGIVAQSLAAEARVLAQPVSFEVTSTTGAEGMEDRMTMAPLAARRLADMVGFGGHIAAIELVVAGQGVDLRGDRPLGRGTARAHGTLRAIVPFMDDGDPVPQDLAPVRALVMSPGFAEGEG